MSLQALKIVDEEIERLFKGEKYEFTPVDLEKLSKRLTERISKECIDQPGPIGCTAVPGCNEKGFIRGYLVDGNKRTTEALACGNHAKLVHDGPKGKLTDRELWKRGYTAK